jgi:hypothetical protein
MVVMAILLLVIVSMGLVVVSPLALRALDSGQIDWTRLSNIGQTYGAVSAIVAAVALLGVMISLVIQNRDAKAARQSARRAHHVELMRMAMDDPRYMECWGPYLTDGFAAEGQYTYVNLIVANWYSEYQVGELPDSLLRASASSVFASGPGRLYWQTTGALWRDKYPGRRAKRFYQVLEETYQDAIKQPPSMPPATVPQKSGSRSSGSGVDRRWMTIAATAAGAVAALAVTRVIRRMLRRH